MTAGDIADAESPVTDSTEQLDMVAIDAGRGDHDPSNEEYKEHLLPTFWSE